MVCQAAADRNSRASRTAPSGVLASCVGTHPALVTAPLSPGSQQARPAWGQAVLLREHCRRCAGNRNPVFCPSKNCASAHDAVLISRPQHLHANRSAREHTSFNNHRSQKGVKLVSLRTMGVMLLSIVAWVTIFPSEA